MTEKQSDNNRSDDHTRRQKTKISRRAYIKIGGISALSAGGSGAIVGKGSAESKGPYGGSVWQIPGQIEAEDFDTGGEGVAYHDTSSGNKGGAYRDTDVDIETSADSTGAYNVGWIDDGEWLEYTVDVTDSDATYDIFLRVAGKNSSGSVDMSLGGEPIGTFDVPHTGDWQSWTTVELSQVSLPGGGEQQLRLDFNEGDFNVNWIEFVSTETSTEATPSVDSLSLAEPETDNADAEFDADWALSDADGNLETAELSLTNLDTGSMMDSVSVAVSGESDSGTTRLVASGEDGSAGTYEVACTAIDSAGNSMSATDTITESEPSGQSPYGGEAWVIPGQIEAEDFDTGGAEIAYHDNSGGNKGGAYRDTDVDIETSADSTGAYNVGWIKDGEWLEYTVDVTDPDATYDIFLRVAGKNSSGSVEVSLGGEPIGTFDVPDTGDWQNWTTVTLSGTSLPSGGKQQLRLDFNEGDFNVNWIEFVSTETSTEVAPSVDSLSLAEPETDNADTEFDVDWALSDADGNLETAELSLTNLDTGSMMDSVSVAVSGESDSGTTRLVASGEDGSAATYEVACTAIDSAGNSTSATDTITESEPSGQSPYGGEPWVIPGRVETEDFDLGGEGVAYHDTSGGNKGGAYRDTDVDINTTDDDSGAFNVAWIKDGEWLEYTVDVTEPDTTYDLLLRVAGKNSAASVDVSIGGESLGTFDIPHTGGWQTWTTVKLPSVSLPDGGEQVLRLDFNDGDFNLNWIDIVNSGATAPTVDSLSFSEVETDNSDAEFDLDWEVSDGDDDLDYVDLQLTNLDTGTIADSESVSVSGTSVSDTTRLVADGADGSEDSYEAACKVVDSSGNTTTSTVSETESEPVTSGDVTQWGVFEASITNTGDYTDSEKYTTVSLDATFGGPNGEAITIPGFWDGGDTFRVRFSPPTAGEWTFETTSNEASLDGKTGSFSASTPSSSQIDSNPNYRGHLGAVVTSDSRYYAYDDGTPFLYAAGSLWDGNSKEMPYDSDFQQYVDDRQSKGFTAIQMLAAEPSNNYAGDRNTGINEGGTMFGGSKSSPDYSVINPTNCQWLDKRIQYIHNQGLAINLFAEWGRVWDEMSQSEVENYWRHLVGRYGAYNVIWTLSGEYDYSDNYGLMDTIGSFVSGIDGQNHLTTIHPGVTQTNVTSTEHFSGANWLDTHTEQTQNNDEVALLEDDWSTEKPLINGEPHVANKYENRLDARRDTWEIFTCGRAAGMGHLYYPIAYDYVNVGDLSNHLDAPVTHDVARAYRFFADVNWQNLTPAPSSVENGTGAWAASHLTDGSLLLVYYGQNDSSELDLSSIDSSSVSVEWYRTSDGSTQTEGVFNAASTHTLSPPDGWSDALLIAKPA